MAGILRWNRFILWLSILLNSNLTGGFALSGPNVCVRNNDAGNRVTFCCFPFYRQNGTCNECENGTLSNDGISCVQCPQNTYGNNCKNRCSCPVQQRCDHRYRCVNDSVLMSTDADVTSHESITDNNTLSTTIDRAGLKSTYFYYTAAGGMIVLSVFFLACIIFFKKRSNARQTKEQHRSQHPFRVERMQSSSRRSIPAFLPPSPRNSQNIYDIID